MGPGVHAQEIDRPYPTLVTTTVMANSDSSGIVTATFGLTTLRKSQLVNWTAFPQWSLTRPPQMPDTRGTGSIGAKRTPESSRLGGGAKEAAGRMTG